MTYKKNQLIGNYFFSYNIIHLKIIFISKNIWHPSKTSSTNKIVYLMIKYLRICTKVRYNLAKKKLRIFFDKIQIALKTLRKINTSLRILLVRSIKQIPYLFCRDNGIASSSAIIWCYRTSPPLLFPKTHKQEKMLKTLQILHVTSAWILSVWKSNRSKTHTK